jgi:hypothetical protein
LTFGTTGATSTNVTASNDGVYTIRFTATDEAGNTAYDEVTLIRDTTAPTASDDVQTGAYYQSAAVTLNCDDTP